MELEDVYKENYPIVYGYLISLCHDPHEAEELAAQTFYRAIIHFFAAMTEAVSRPHGFVLLQKISSIMNVNERNDRSGFLKWSM